MHLLVSSAYGHNVPSLMFDLLKIHVEVCCEEKLCILIKLVLQGSSITVPPLKNDLSVRLQSKSHQNSCVSLTLSESPGGLALAQSFLRRNSKSTLKIMHFSFQFFTLIVISP